MKEEQLELNLDKGLYYNATHLHKPEIVKWSIGDKLDTRYFIYIKNYVAIKKTKA